MEEQLPRETLWADKKKMEEFMSEPLNQRIYGIYLNLNRDKAIKDYETLKLFNEVYYQCSRIINSIEPKINLADIISDIKENLGWNYSSSLVVNMIYAVLSVRRNNSQTVIDFINQIKSHYRLETYNTPFSLMVKDYVERGETYNIDFPIQHKKQRKRHENIVNKEIKETFILLKQQLYSGRQYVKAPINLTVNINNEIRKIGNFIMDNHGTIKNESK